MIPLFLKKQTLKTTIKLYDFVFVNVNMKYDEGECIWIRIITFSFLNVYEKVS